MLPKNFNEPMGAPAIFEKQIEIKLLHPASTLESRIQEPESSIFFAQCFDRLIALTSIEVHPCSSLFEPNY
ncbi:MAG: hypothetical protein P8X74_02830 [Reinekea sp.]